MEYCIGWQRTLFDRIPRKQLVGSRAKPGSMEKHNVTEWEYRKLALNNHRPRGDEIDLLNDAGMDGWELVEITSNHIAYLKRRILSNARQNSSTRSAQAHTANRPVSVEAKYRDPTTNETWSGRGRMANWLKRKQEAGENIDKYLA